MRTAKYLIVIVGLIISCLAPVSSFAQSASRPGQMPLAQPQASAPTTAPAAQPGAATPELGYILGPEDVVQVGILGRTDFDSKSKIGTDGKIQLPLLGAFPAADRTVL